MSHPETVICIYRVRSGQEEAFQKLLERHWPTLRELSLVTGDPPRHYRGAEQSGEPLYVEMFEWASAEASSTAHEHPEVMAIWEPMEPDPDRYKAIVAAVTPMLTDQSPEDIADTVAFLCSGRAASITGQTVAVDGGMTQGAPIQV